VRSFRAILAKLDPPGANTAAEATERAKHAADEEAAAITTVGRLGVEGL